MNRWVETLEEEVFQGLGRGLLVLELAQGERQQTDEGDATGEALADAGEEIELLGARQDEEAGAAVAVDGRLEVREQLRRPLDLVEDGSVGIARQEPARIVGRELPLVQVFERYEGPVGNRPAPGSSCRTASGR